MKEKTPTPKIKSARKVAEHVLSNAEWTQRIRKGFLCDALCAFASLREILAFWDLNFISCQKACARMLLSSMAENYMSVTYKLRTVSINLV